MPTADPIGQILQKAIDLHRSGRIEVAENLYRTILQTQPQHPEANYQLGCLAVQAKQAEQGVSYFSMALEAGPSEERYWLGYIEALIQAKQSDMALQLLVLGRQHGLQGEAVEALARQIETLIQPAKCVHSPKPKFNLVHCIPNPRMHGLNGYKEVIDTISWGLEQLGHQVTYSVNKFCADSTNIVFGSQVMPMEALKTIPRDSIIYNFEQIRGLKPDKIRPQALYFAKNFEVWDYSAANLATWKSLGRTDTKIVPVGYAPILNKIPKAQIQDIDVLLYGMSGPNRLDVFHTLSKAGLSAMFVSGLYGTARDDLIARSKIVLNINLYEFAKIFEVVRVSYLLANSKAVVSDLDPRTYVEDDIRSGLMFSSLKNIVASCHSLIENNARRLKLETAGFAAISKRDIQSILETALQN